MYPRLFVFAFLLSLSFSASADSLGHWIQSQKGYGSSCHIFNGQLVCEDGPIQSPEDCSSALPRQGVMCRLVQCQAIDESRLAFERLGFKFVGSNPHTSLKGICSLYFTDPNFRR